MNRDWLRVYAITDRGWTGSRSLPQQVEEALQGGVTMVQLREKNLEESAFLEEAIQIKQLCRRYRVPLIINDNLTVALKSGADGVHVGADDLSVAQVRALAGEHFLIGATAKTVEQAQLAQAQGADYLGVGAVFPSPTKTNARRITREQLKEICSCVTIPVAAIGGITADNLPRLRGCGIAGIAVISAIFAAEDIPARVRQLRNGVDDLLIMQEEQKQ